MSSVEPDRHSDYAKKLVNRRLTIPASRVDMSTYLPYSRRMKLSKTFTWYIRHPQELKRYAGKHVAIVDDGIAAVADSSWQAYHKAKKKHPDKEPALTFIPKGDFLIL